MESNIISFWENCHKREIEEFLSGSKYDEIISFLKVDQLIEKDSKVLEVGVGFGYVVQGLHDFGAIVSALDVSYEVLSKVEDICEYVYSVEDVYKLPSNYFDCIMCVNVVQHVPTDLLKEELKHCIRSLKENSGVMAVEFVSANDTEDLGLNASEAFIKNGYCCRAPDYFIRMVEELGGVCDIVSSKDCDINGVHAWHVAHIWRGNYV